MSESHGFCTDGKETQNKGNKKAWQTTTKSRLQSLLRTGEQKWKIKIEATRKVKSVFSR